MSNVISAEGVGFRYGGVPVLREVTLGLAAGSMLAVTGPNGSGKSTLLHLLAGVGTPTEGRVHRDRGTRVSLLPQRTGDIDALPLTVAECVRIGRFRPLRRLRRADRLAVDAMLDRLELADLADRRLRELSGGQRQRTLLAQALVQDAEVYVLDEPTAALDTGSRARVHELLAERRADGAAMVLASHDADESALADEVLTLG
ncbi:zinc ABC transporter ATP-binding protein AztA [Cryptosporangium japonicum]|uniref:Zinc ABC transporter ATP-binding protein AztA n=1 Tax=Cryptosporangium japonicum TaxID=80872 RepID=A0ABN0V4K6_9ACTN